MTTPSSSGPDIDLAQLSFEDLLARLEELTRLISSGDIGIEQAADLYDQAGRIHAAAAARLDQVRSRIENIAPPASTSHPDPDF